MTLVSVAADGVGWNAIQQKALQRTCSVKAQFTPCLYVCRGDSDESYLCKRDLSEQETEERRAGKGDQKVCMMKTKKREMRLLAKAKSG